jgi:hypothetical protein
VARSNGCSLLDLPTLTSPGVFFGQYRADKFPGDKQGNDEGVESKTSFKS